MPKLLTPRQDSTWRFPLDPELCYTILYFLCVCLALGALYYYG